MKIKLILALMLTFSVSSFADTGLVEKVDGNYKLIEEYVLNYYHTCIAGNNASNESGYIVVCNGKTGMYLIPAGYKESVATPSISKEELTKARIDNLSIVLEIMYRHGYHVLAGSGSADLVKQQSIVFEKPN